MWTDDTDDPWKTWFVQIDGVRWANTVDLSVAAEAPNARLPICMCIRVPVVGSEDWFFTVDEGDDLDRLVDGLADLTTGRPRGLRRLLPRSPNEARFVGRRAREGECELYWYSSRRIRKRDYLALKAVVPGLQWSGGSREDPAWRIYLNALHPGAALNPLLTSWAQLRQRKREFGEDLVIPREVSHTLKFGDEEARARFIAASPDWLVSTYEVRDAPDGRRFAVILSRTHIIAQMISDTYIIALSDLAESCGGIYDGWGAMVEGVEDKEEGEFREGGSQ